MAVAGTSFGGTTQIPVFQTHPRTQVVAAVSSGRVDRAAQTARDFGIPNHYTDFEQMLDREKPNLVSIATPPEFHFPMTMAALSRGIHVLCEKPFALDIEEARRMKAAADHSDVVAMIDFEFRFLPATAYGLELVRQNYIGQVRMVDFSAHFGFRAVAEDMPWNWWSDENRGGGVLGAIGSHAADMLRLAVGAPRRVICDLVTFVPQRSGKPVTSDDSCELILEFNSGARAGVQISASCGATEARLGIYGSEGQLSIPNIYGPELLGAKRADRIAAIEIPETFRIDQEHPTLRAPFRVLLTRMVHAIDNHLPSPSPNFEDAVASQAVLDSARLSHRKRCWVDIL